MNDNKQKIMQYYYMDIDQCKERDKILEKIYGGEKYKNLDYYDLEIYNDDGYKTKIIKELFKSKINNKIMLTYQQVEILNILKSNNLFLSAPTSFGKTFIILEFIKRNPSLKNIVFVVPTLALMNELLKKMYTNFGSEYNICINENEEIKEKNIFIFVPERSGTDFINKIKEIGLDFLVVDEIYKLKPKNNRELNDDDRIILMNKVYLDLINTAKKIALLGPFISDVKFKNSKIEIFKYYTNLNLVHNKVSYYLDENWEKLIDSNKKTLVYFKSPESIYNNIDRLLNALPVIPMLGIIYNKEINYLKENIDKNWYIIEFLKRGIGVHHGKTPTFLRKFYESEFSNGYLHCLLCTNTLMEGINTPTSKMIVVDSPDSTFQLNNLLGRVGRLNPNKPILGEIYLCDKKAIELYEKPQMWEELIILSEDENVHSPDEVVYLNKKNITDKSKNDELKNKQRYLLENYNISGDDIRKYNVRFNKVYKFGSENYKQKFLSATKIHDCIKYSKELIKIDISKFKLNNFENLSSQNSSEYLPYLYYIQDLLFGHSIKEMVSVFNCKYNKNRNQSNVNKFIDIVLELNSIIKFKLVRIVDYLNLFKVDIKSNKNLELFISKLENYDKLSVPYKILDDLGIEQKDFPTIVNELNITDAISTSKMIGIIRQNKEQILSKKISPFTKNNINNLIND